GEGAFALDSLWHPVGRALFPCRPTIRGRDDQESPVYGITDGKAMHRIPERHGIEEGFRIAICVLQLPVLTSIDSFEDSRLLALTDTQEICCLCVERIDVPEIERGRIRGCRRDVQLLPGRTAVGGAEAGALTSARPCDPFVDRAHTPQSCTGSAG